MTNLTPLEKKVIAVVQGFKEISCAQLREILFSNPKIAQKVVSKLEKLGYLELDGWGIRYTGKEVI